jgi:hypothetical protein
MSFYDPSGYLSSEEDFKDIDLGLCGGFSFRFKWRDFSLEPAVNLYINMTPDHDNWWKAHRKDFLGNPHHGASWIAYGLSLALGYGF